MDASTELASHSHAGHDPHGHDGGHEHHELGWWRKYVFSTDHKVIGIQYGITGLVFLFFGFCLMMLMRWQIAYPGRALPVIGNALGGIFGPGSMPDGKMTPDLYNSFGAMHGTIMVFLAIVPLAFAAFGNFVVPLQIGAPDMAFPADQHGELPGLLRRRRDHVGQLLHSGRRGPGGLDFLFAAPAIADLGPRITGSSTARRSG